MKDLRFVIDELLLEGIIDWVGNHVVYGIAVENGEATTEAEAKRLSLAMVERVLADGLMRIGDYVEAGFVAWECSHEEAVDRVDHEWTALGRRPRAYEIFTLSTTREGDRLGYETFLRRTADPNDSWADHKLSPSTLERLQGSLGFDVT